MKATRSRVVKAIPFGARVGVCDNSGAKLVRIFAVKGSKTVRRRISAAGVADLVIGSVVSGRPDIRKQVVFGVIVRQKKEYQRPSGERIKFEDNAMILLKDDKGNPRGTIFKGPVAKEVTERWPGIAKVASIVI